MSHQSLPKKQGRKPYTMTEEQKKARSEQVKAQWKARHEARSHYGV